MEATARDGDHGLWSWRRKYRSEQAGSISSSGTIASSAGTYASIGTRLSSVSSVAAAAMHLDLASYYREDTEDEQMKRATSMVQEFFFDAPSSSGITGGDMVFLERWFTEMGVAWVLQLADDGGASAGCLEGELEHAFVDARVPSWIRGLSGIKKICYTASPLPDHDVDSMVVLPSICEQPVADQFRFTQFIQHTMLKMLPFVDAVLLALDANINHEVFIADNGVVPALYNKINILHRVYGALSETLPNIEVLFLSTGSVQIKTIRSEMISLLSAKVSKVTEAIWASMEWIWARIMEEPMENDDDDSSHTPPTSIAESAGIHKATRSVTNHIRYLWDNYWSVTPIAFEAASQSLYLRSKYSAGPEREIGETSNPLARLTVQMLSCLQEKLAQWSQSFPDQGLRFLFLINNSHYISQQLHTTYRIFLRSYFAALGRKIEDHIQTYIQVSWEPVLSCLFTPTPRLFGKSQPLPSFQLEFQKTFTTQKLWKVPDPELRKTLREAIIEKIVPAYTRYKKDNKGTAPKFTPHELQEMLYELFEG